jgi:hypothetical protein
LAQQSVTGERKFHHEGQSKDRREIAFSSSDPTLSEAEKGSRGKKGDKEGREELQVGRKMERVKSG